jgi:hypothetical protein
LRQAQLELKPFDRERLRNVAIRLRELYPAKDRDRLMGRISDEFVDLLVDKVTEGFRGDVGVVPRQFLREFVTQMDMVEEHEDYVPMQEYGFEPAEMAPEEQAAISGRPDETEESEAAEMIPSEDVW